MSQAKLESKYVYEPLPSMVSITDVKFHQFHVSSKPIWRIHFYDFHIGVWVIETKRNLAADARALTSTIDPTTIIIYDKNQLRQRSNTTVRFFLLALLRVRNMRGRYLSSRYLADFAVATK